MPAKMPEALVARPFAAKLRCVGFELHHRRLPLSARPWQYLGNIVLRPESTVTTKHPESQYL